MAIPLTGSGGLFTRIGRVGKLVLLCGQYQSSLPAALESLYSQYDGLTPGTGLRDVISDAIALRASVVADPARWLPVLQGDAQQTILRMVQADAPASSGSISDALSELIRQMAAGSQTVQKSTVGATATAFGGNSGDGQVVVSTVGGDGKPLELSIAETARLSCADDSFDGSGVAGEEGFTFAGQVGASTLGDVFAYDWPAGSAANFGLSAVDPDSTANLLEDSDFETYTIANTPDQWVIGPGVAGTDVLKDATNFYSGTSSVQFVGGATLTALAQTFGDSVAGTAGKPVSLAPYAVSLWLRVSSVPAAGVLTVELVDGTGSVVNDNAGTPNSFTINLAALPAATWKAEQGIFRLPKALPATLKIRLRLSTALSAGTNLNLDHLAMTAMRQPYTGGPFVAVCSGTSPFAAGDGWSVVTTNDRGGASNNSTFQALFDRLFAMRSLGLVLPSSATPTIADTLITS